MKRASANAERVKSFINRIAFSSYRGCRAVKPKLQSLQSLVLRQHLRLFSVLADVLLEALD
jgi:hypothetical protein